VIWRNYLAALAVAFAVVAPATATTVTFEDGEASGWEGPQGLGGSTIVDPHLGNPGGSLHTIFNDFGITFSTTTNEAFLGDYTALPVVQLGLDVKTQFLNFFGMDVTREFVVELRDFDNPPDGLPWTSVWYKLGVLDAADAGWHTWSVTIDDTSALDLPPGWGGYGAEDPETFEPELPADRTFASVLAGVDEVAFTTLVPGFFFGFADHDVAIDNVFIKPVPEPSTFALAGLGLAGVAVARLRKRRISA
jgi:hypothetical protein